MNKLLTLLGQVKYDLLKTAMGNDFESFEKDFEDGVITDTEVTAKLTELDIKDPTTEEDPVVKDMEDTVVEEPITEEVVDIVEDNKVSDLSTVLEDGWLIDGKVDLEKILYEPLRGFIAGLQDIAVKADWYAKYKIAVLSEALKQGMFDIDDANRFISSDDLSTDNDGNIIGIKEAFDKLRAEKPHLFKPVIAGSKSHIDGGFNPVDNKVTGKPRSYAEAVEQTRALQVQ